MVMYNKCLNMSLHLDKTTVELTDINRYSSQCWTILYFNNSFKIIDTYALVYGSNYGHHSIWFHTILDRYHNYLNNLPQFVTVLTPGRVPSLKSTG